MLQGKRVIAIIPARGGSKGVPKKNLRLFDGRTLLERAIQVAKASCYVDKVVVSSDADEIIEKAKKAGAETPFVRPAELARDDTPSVDVVLHALESVEEKCDYVVLLQPTSPLRTVSDLDSCIEHCFNLGAFACVSVVKVDQHPYWMVTIDEKQRLIPFVTGVIPFQRQKLPPIYMLNGAIYIAKVDWFLKKRNFLTKDTVAFEMKKENSLDIDNEFDFLLLELYAKNRNFDFSL